MADSIRLKRLQKTALQTASKVVLYELADPRLSLVTLTRCKLTSDLSWITIHWSVLGNEADKSKVSHALNQARSVVQGAIADAFQTRRTPRIRWEFDESIQGALRVGRILDQLKAERGEEDEGDVDVEPDAVE